MVIATHKRAKHLRLTLEALIPQKPDGVVVVCDGHDPATARLLSKHADNGFQGIVLLEHHGVNHARRAATSIVPEDAVVVELDDHDIPEPDALDALREAFRDPDTHAAYGDALFIDRHGALLAEGMKKLDYEPFLLLNQGSQLLGMRAYRKRVYDAAGGWQLAEWPAGDYALFLRIEEHLDGKGIVRIARPLCRVRRGIVGSLSILHVRDQDKKADEYRMAAMIRAAKKPDKAEPEPEPPAEAKTQPEHGDHVLFAVPFWGPSYGGGELTMLRYARQLLDRGIKLKVAGRRKRLNHSPGWWDTVHVDVGPDVAVRIHEQRPLLVVFQDNPTPTEAAVCQRLRIPYVIIFAFWHNLLPTNSPTDWERIRSGEGLNEAVVEEARDGAWGASVIIANSEWMKSRVGRIIGGTQCPRRIDVCHPPLGRRPIVRGERRAEYVLMPQVQEPKGLLTFLKLARDFPDERFVGLNGMGKFLPESQALLKELPNVEIRSWTDDMGAVYRRTKVIYIGTQTAETYCRAAAEARVNGIPLLVSDAGNLPNICSKPEHGQVVARDAEYHVWREAFRKVLALNGRAPKDRSYINAAGERFVAQRCMDLVCGRSAALVYPEHAPGVGMAAKHLAATTGVRLFTSQQLGEVACRDWALVILAGDYGHQYSAFVEQYKGPVALSWYSSAEQMEWHPHEIKLWESALKWVRSRDNAYMFASDKRLAGAYTADAGDGLRYLPCTFAVHLAPPLWPRRFWAPDKPWKLALLGPNLPRKRLRPVVEAGKELGVHFQISKRLWDAERSGLLKGIKVKGDTHAIHDLKTQADVIDLMRRCDVAVFPSAAETFCYAAAEALLGGTLTLATRSVPIANYPRGELRERLRLTAKDDDRLVAEIVEKVCYLRDYVAEAKRLAETAHGWAIKQMEERNETARKVLKGVLREVQREVVPH